MINKLQFKKAISIVLIGVGTWMIALPVYNELNKYFSNYLIPIVIGTILIIIGLNQKGS